MVTLELCQFASLVPYAPLPRRGKPLSVYHPPPLLLIRALEKLVDLKRESVDTWNRIAVEKLNGRDGELAGRKKISRRDSEVTSR